MTTLLAGWYPRKVISALLPVRQASGPGQPQPCGRNRYLHRALIVFQFTISLVFIIGTVIVARQLHYVHETRISGLTKTPSSRSRR